MHTANCPHCTAKFSHPTVPRTLQAVNLHIRSRHKKAELLVKTDLVESNGPDEPKPKPKRAYVKRVLKPETGTVVTSHRHEFQFCPSCGLNLYVLMQAMQAAAKFSR